MKIKFILVLPLLLLLISSGLAQQDPKEAELLFMARKAYEDGFYEVSLGMLEKFQKQYVESANLAQAKLLSAECYFFQGRYLEALNIFQSLENDPSADGFKDALYFWMAEVHFKGNNFQKAGQLYQKLIDRFPHSSFIPAGYYSLGWSFFQQGQVELAMQTFGRLIQDFPQEPQAKDAAFKLIECLYDLKKYTQLKSQIMPVIKLYGNDVLRLPYLYFYLAESEFYLHELDQAAKDYLKSAQNFKEPKAVALAKLGLGWSYLKLTKYKEAEEVFAEIKSSSLDKKSLEILQLGQALLFSATNRIYESIKLYTVLINSSQDILILLQAYLGSADARYELAEYALAVKLYQEGLGKISQGSRQGAELAELADKLRYNLGLAYIKLGQLDASAEAFNSIKGKDRNSSPGIDLLFQIGQAYADANDFVRAQETYAKILKLYPGSGLSDYAHYQLVWLAIKGLDFGKAATELERMWKKYPQSKYLPDAWYALGEAFFQQADYQRSVEILIKFRNEFKTSPLRAQALYLLGAALVSLDKHQEALDIFKELAVLDSLDVLLRQKVEYALADGYYKTGQEDEAVSRFKLLRTKYPGAELIPDVLWWLGQYYYRNNNSNLARRYFYSLTKEFPNSAQAGNAFYALGLSFSDEHKFDAAAENFKLAIKFGQLDLKKQASLALADLMLQAQKPQAALLQYQEMIKADPDLGPQLFSKIAEIFFNLGDYAGAKTYYYKSLKAAAGSDLAKLRFNLAETLKPTLNQL